MVLESGGGRVLVMVLVRGGEEGVSHSIGKGW